MQYVCTTELAYGKMLAQETEEDYQQLIDLLEKKFHVQVKFSKQCLTLIF